MAYEGYLIKFGSSVLANKLLVSDSYSCIPNQKIVINEFIDDTRKIHRDTWPDATKTTLSVTTKNFLTTAQKEEIQRCMSLGVLDETNGIYRVTFFNPRKDQYETMDAFLTPIEYRILNIYDTGPVYGAVTISLETNRG